MKASPTSSWGLAVTIFVNCSTDSDILQVSVFDVRSIFANGSTDPDIWQFWIASLSLSSCWSVYTVLQILTFGSFELHHAHHAHVDICAQVYIFWHPVGSSLWRDDNCYIVSTICIIVYQYHLHHPYLQQHRIIRIIFYGDSPGIVYAAGSVSHHNRYHNQSFIRPSSSSASAAAQLYELAFV